jgi:hypothetical protein
MLNLKSRMWSHKSGSVRGSGEQSPAPTRPFCRAWVDSLLAVEGVAICELTVDGRAVAISLNAISGHRLFALKIGWNAAFAACSPGTLCELFLLQSVRNRLPEVKLVDSCAQPHSYVEKVWPWRISLTHGVFPTTKLGRLAVDSMLRIKFVKRLLRG